MIQASELRLGNWLYASGNTIETYQTSKPKQVTIEFLNAIKVENEERPDAFLTWFSPIPLTPEVLEKCGFENIGSYWTDKNTNGDILLDTGANLYIEQYSDSEFEYCVSYSTYNGFGVNVKYLHQLQNLYFALTGEELEYKP